MTHHTSAASCSTQRLGEKGWLSYKVDSAYLYLIIGLTISTIAQKDPGGPLEGEACNPDGTLKDASEITWIHSPSNMSPPPLPKQMRDDTDLEQVMTKKARVSSGFMRNELTFHGFTTSLVKRWRIWSMCW